MTDASQELCTFILDGQLFGLEIEHVQEIVHEQPITRVPLAPAPVRGLMNLRGEIVTVLDLRRPGGPEPSPGASSVSVVLRTEGGKTSLRVDDIGEIVRVDDNDFEPPPANLRGAGHELIRGVYKTPGRLLLLLDLAKCLATSTVRNT